MNSTFFIRIFFKYQQWKKVWQNYVLNMGEITRNLIVWSTNLVKKISPSETFHIAQNDSRWIYLQQLWVIFHFKILQHFLFIFFFSKIDARWRFVISAFLVMTFGCWTFFAMLWYLIAYAHNDLTFDSETGLPLHDGQMTCIRGVESATAFFLYSFEIQVKHCHFTKIGQMCMSLLFRRRLDLVNDIQTKNVQKRFSCLWFKLWSVYCLIHRWLE